MIANSECGRVRGPQWMKWLDKLKGQKAYGLEIGTFQGDSAEFMLDNIFTHPDSCYICVDPFTGSEEHKRFKIDVSDNEQIARKKLARFGSKVVFVKEPSYKALRNVMAVGELDFLYIDGAHDTVNVLRDSVMGFELLKVGGVMIWDDYRWKELSDTLDRPEIAIDSFRRCYARQITLLPPIGWQVAVAKLYP